MWGQLTPATCGDDIFNHSGYVVADASGPWAGTSLVTEKSVEVTLLKALRPDLYENGPTHARPVAGNTLASTAGASWATALINGCDDAFSADITVLTVWQVNKECGVSTNYDVIVSVVDAHEDEHAKDIREQVEAHNITSYWDTLYGTTSFVETRVKEVLDPAVTAVEAAAEKADLTGGGNVGHLWRWSKSNDGWLWYLVHRAH